MYSYNTVVLCQHRYYCFMLCLLNPLVTVTALWSVFIKTKLWDRLSDLRGLVRRPVIMYYRYCWEHVSTTKYSHTKMQIEVAVWMLWSKPEPTSHMAVHSEVANMSASAASSVCDEWPSYEYLPLCSAVEAWHSITWMRFGVVSHAKSKSWVLKTFDIKCCYIWLIARDWPCCSVGSSCINNMMRLMHAHGTRPWKICKSQPSVMLQALIWACCTGAYVGWSLGAGQHTFRVKRRGMRRMHMQNAHT